MGRKSGQENMTVKEKWPSVKVRLYLGKQMHLTADSSKYFTDFLR